MLPDLKDRTPSPAGRWTPDTHFPGTLAWSEHVEAWHGYDKRYPSSGRDQDADMVAQRGGFSYGELVEYLGREPATWRVHPQFAERFAQITAAAARDPQGGAK